MMLLQIQTRPLAAWELNDPSIHDTILFDVTAIRMAVADAPKLASVIETAINEHLGRDAVRVTPRVQMFG